jgi:cytidylate kinase
MAVITLSWQLGCQADRIAQDVATELQYHIIGKQELHDMLVRASDHFSEDIGLNEFSQVVDGEIQQDFFFRTHRDSSVYSSFLLSLLYTAASQDNVFLKGFGAYLALAGHPHVLCVRLQGSLDVRTAVIQKQRQLDRRAAHALIKKDDRERMGFVQYLFHRELTDTQLHDLVINVGKFPRQAMTTMIANAARAVEHTYPMTDGDRIALQSLAFASRIKAVIQRIRSNIPGLAVDVGSDNIVTITGNVVQQREKDQIEERVRAIPDVQNVRNNLTVGSPFGRRRS